MQEEKPDPIDVEMQKRLDTGRGMTFALSWAEDQWDKEMNRAYKAAMTNLPARQKALLKASQQEWLRYRDREFDLLAAFLTSAANVTPSTGNPARLDFGGVRVKFVKDRALTLRRYKSNPFNREGNE